MLLPPPSEDDRYADLLRRVRDLETALRAAFTTISGGAGIQIVDGGALALVGADGTVLFYIGPVSPDNVDGSPQPGWEVRRADGTLVLRLRDAFPGVDGTLNQALTWLDRAGNAVLADDTDSGQGMARPNLSGGFSRTRFVDWNAATAVNSWQTLWDYRVTKHSPRLEVWWRGSMDTAGTTGETRVLVNGLQLGATQSHSFLAETKFVGPLPVAGAHMSTLIVEIQAQRTSASGALRVEGLGWYQRQS